MAENKMTQAQAIRWLIDNAVNAPADVIEAAEKVYTAKTKTYPRAKVASKERRINEGLVPVMVELVANAPEPVGAKWLAEHCDAPEVRSSQKVVAIMNIALEQGLVAKTIVKNRTCYTIPE